MFPSWGSLQSAFEDDRTFQSNLHLLPREVVVEICKNVCKSLVPKPTTTSTPAPTVPALQPLGGHPSASFSVATSEKQSGILESEDLVNYCMEVLSFALSLDFEHHEVIRDATFVYCDWLSALSHIPKSSVPDCICANPNLYCQRMIKQLYNLFVPRERQFVDVVQKQGVLCHRALRTIQEIFKTSMILQPETWNVLLQTLLTICDVVLSRTMEVNDFSDYFSKRLLGVLFDLWLTACQRSFPPAVYWKTFSLMSHRWRHRLPVIEEWLRVSVLLFEKTYHLVAGKTPANAIVFRTAEHMKVFEDWKPTNLVVLPTDDLLIQTQMRILLLSMNNLAEIASVEKVVSFADKKLRAMSLPQDSFKNPDAASSSHTLAPLIFLKLMTGVTIMVDLAMNMLASIDSYLDIMWPELLQSQLILSNTQLDVMGGPTQPSGVSGESLVLLAKGRPLRCEIRIPCRGLLHLFGPWLFQASMAGRTDGGKGGDLADPEKEAVLVLMKDSDLRQPGRAEAVGSLCRIFSFFSDGPNLSPTISSRMALVLSSALSLEGPAGFALSNAIRNSHDIFRADVRGFETVLPVLLPALEVIILQKIPKQNLYPEIGPEDLRTAALHLLSSIISLPKYFDLLPLNDIRTASGKGMKRAKEDMETFGSVYYRLLDLVLNGIVIETNPANCMLLLGCLYAIFVHPCVESGLEESTDIRFSNGNKVFIAITHLFNSSLWLQDSTLSYACLEFLHTCARYSTRLLDQTTTKLVISALCRYIQEQAQKPARAHSKDLHNKIIVAYHCLTAWMLEWPSVLQENELLTLIADVIETGLTGVRPSKVLKTSQPASAVSARVRDMAELAQLILLEFVGCSQDPGCFQYLDNLVAEDDILADASKSMSSRFHYFTIDGSACILGALCSMGSNGETYIVERSLSCRRSYHMQFVRSVPGLKIPNVSVVQNGGDSEYLEEKVRVETVVPPAKRSRIAEDADWDFVAFRNEIPGYNKIEKCLADDMLPTFADVMKKNEKKEKEISYFLEAFDRIEAEVVFTLPDAKSFQAYTPPSIIPTNPSTPDSEAIVVQQVLSHLGLKPPSVYCSPAGSLLNPSTVQLDHRNPALRQALTDLDKISIRPLDWVFSFYVGRDDHNIYDILSNGDDLGNCSQDFVRFLSSLAWPVSVADVVSRRLPTDKTEVLCSCLDGKEWCLLRSEVSHQLGLIVPSSGSLKKQEDSPFSSPGSFLADSERYQFKNPLVKVTKVRSFSVDDVDAVAGPKSAQQRPRKHASPPEPRFVCLFVWMETFKDNFVFPAAEMLKNLDMDQLYWQWHNEEDNCDMSNTPFEYRIIYIYPAAHGLYEVRLRNMDGNPLLAAIPLINGMVLSHNILPSLTADCVVNLFTRKRLALESYAPGQVRRRNHIQDITNRFAVGNVTDTSWAS